MSTNTGQADLYLQCYLNPINRNIIQMIYNTNRSLALIYLITVETFTNMD